MASGASRPPPANPKGILKSPRFTRSLVESSAATAMEAKEAEVPFKASTGNPEPSSFDVVERKGPRRKNKAKRGQHQQPKPTVISPAAAASSIEGYVPAEALRTESTQLNHQHANTSTTKQNSNGEETQDMDLIFNSLADLMDKAGTLPKEEANDPSVLEQEGTVVEAELNFNVMSPEEFEAQIEDQEEGHVDNDALAENPALDNDSNNNMLGVVDHDAEENYDRFDDAEKENSEDESGGIWDLMDEDDDLEPAISREPRAFLQLWNALSQWITPEAVDYVMQQRQQDNDDASERNQAPLHPEWSDVESTRCAGLMSLLQLYIVPCLREDLGQPLEDRRRVEQRLGIFIRCFSYSRPSPKLNASHARALTCLLVQTVMPKYYDRENKKNIPSSCVAVGLTEEEYTYLVTSAIPNFQSLP